MKNLKYSKIENTKTILIPIYKKYADLIISGKKKWEYRKYTPENVKKIWLYQSDINPKILGYFTVKKTVKDEPYKIWFMSSKDSGINHIDFFSYYKNCNYAIAYEIGEFFPIKENFKFDWNYIDLKD